MSVRAQPPHTSHPRKADRPDGTSLSHANDMKAAHRTYEPAPRPPSRGRCPLPPGQSAEAFHKGVQALTQYREREGGGPPGRAHIGHLSDGTQHRTGVWIVNQKQRRDWLNPDQLEALAALGVDWAQ